MISFLKTCGKGLLTIILSPFWVAFFVLYFIYGIFLLLYTGIKTIVLMCTHKSHGVYDTPYDKKAKEILSNPEYAPQTMPPVQIVPVAVPVPIQPMPMVQPMPMPVQQPQQQYIPPQPQYQQQPPYPNQQNPYPSQQPNNGYPQQNNGYPQPNNNYPQNDQPYQGYPYDQNNGWDDNGGQR